VGSTQVEDNTVGHVSGHKRCLFEREKITSHYARQLPTSVTKRVSLEIGARTPVFKRPLASRVWGTWPAFLELAVGADGFGRRWVGFEPLIRGRLLCRTIAVALYVSTRCGFGWGWFADSAGGACCTAGAREVPRCPLCCERGDPPGSRKQYPSHCCSWASGVVGNVAPFVGIQTPRRKFREPLTLIFASVSLQ
jgi:hypothetical protein